MAESLRCCICDEPVSPPPHIIGQRVYCARHYAAINKPHPGFWRAGVVQIVGMGAFSIILAVLAGGLGELDRSTLILIGLFLAVVPTALWLVYFYRQDRLEPEPKTRIAQVLLLALLLTDALGLRLVRDWFQVSNWAATNNLTSLLASILIQGFTWQAITYVAVRVVVYTTSEFDERMDGIVYGTIAGLGVATLLNLHYIIDNQGVALAPGAIHVVTTALAQASFGGVMGYFIAQAKFAHMPVWWVPLGVGVAAVLNGLFSWLINEVSAAGLTVEPWRSLALGLVVALASFFALVVMMRRATHATLSRPAVQSAPGAALYRLRTLRKDVGVGVVVLLALGLGWLLRNQVLNRTQVFQDSDSPFQMAYPATWASVESLQEALLKVEDPTTDSAFKTALTVEARQLDPQDPPTLQTLIDRRVEQRSALTGYHFLSEAPVTVGGAKAQRLEYAYVTQPIDAPRRASLPVVVQAREYIVVARDNVYYLTLAAPEAEFGDASARFEQIIQTVQVQ